MWLASKAITVFLRARKVRGKPGNHDPLTREFIDLLFDLWTDLFWAETAFDESQLFRRMVVAAWRDFRLPDKEEDGVLLEAWLFDRIRKRFPQGICQARLRYQRHDNLKGE
jgi:hypothetical protein